MSYRIPINYQNAGTINVNNILNNIINNITSNIVSISDIKNFLDKFKDKIISNQSKYLIISNDVRFTIEQATNKNGYYIKFIYKNPQQHIINNIHCTLIENLPDIHFTTVIDDKNNNYLKIFRSRVQSKFQARPIHFRTYYNIKYNNIENNIKYRNINLKSCKYYEKTSLNSSYYYIQYFNNPNYKFNFIKTKQKNINMNEIRGKCEILLHEKQTYSEFDQYFNEEIFIGQTSSHKTNLYNFINKLIIWVSGYKNASIFNDFFIYTINNDETFKKYYDIQLYRNLLDNLNESINLNELDILNYYNYNNIFYKYFMKLIDSYKIFKYFEKGIYQYDYNNNVFIDLDGDYILFDSTDQEMLKNFQKNRDKMSDDDDNDDIMVDDDMWGGNPINTSTLKISEFFYNGFTSAKYYNPKWIDIKYFKKIFEKQKYVEIEYIKNGEKHYKNTIMYLENDEIHIKLDNKIISLDYKNNKLINNEIGIIIEIDKILILDMEGEVISYHINENIPDKLYDYFDYYLKYYNTDLKISMSIDTNIEDYNEDTDNYIPIIINLNNIKYNGNKNIIIHDDYNNYIEITNNNKVTIFYNNKKIEHNNTYDILYITLFK